MLTQLADDVFGQAAPSGHNEAPQPNKLVEAVVRFADIVVDGAVQEALNLQGIVDAVRADAQPERLAKFVVNAFGDALVERNHAAAKQRKCDLNAVLKAAIAHRDFVVAAAGLQANAKAARGHGKPAKSAKPKTLGVDGIEVQDTDPFNVVLALLSQARDLADNLGRDAMVRHIEAILNKYN